MKVTYMLGYFFHRPKHALVDSIIVDLARGAEYLSLHAGPHNPEGVSQDVADEPTEAS